MFPVAWIPAFAGMTPVFMLNINTITVIPAPAPAPAFARAGSGGKKRTAFYAERL